MSYELILIDDPAPHVRRITLNRPEKRNAISTPMRKELLAALQAADIDDGVRVSIIRGAGPCFSSGYDLSDSLMDDPPHYTAGGDGEWSRHVTDSWLAIWELAKPVIAQIHGYALAGASELAAACDLVYVADNADIGHPVVAGAEPARFQLPPLAGGIPQRHGDDAHRRLLLRYRGGGHGIRQPGLSRGRTGRAGAGDGPAGGPGPVRSSTDQQAQCASGHGGDGHSQRHPHHVGVPGPGRQCAVGARFQTAGLGEHQVGGWTAPPRPVQVPTPREADADLATT